MIRFDRKDNVVEATIELVIPGTKRWYYTFKFLENDEPTAQLITNHIHDQLEKKLKEIRDHSYTEGWKDAKAKRRKITWFSGWW